MTSRSRPGPVIDLPSACTVPLSGFSSPAMMLSNVVLPQPLAPTRQTNSPSATFRLTRSSARTAPDAPLKFFETFSIASFDGAMTSSSSAAEEWWRESRCITEFRPAWRYLLCLSRNPHLFHPALIWQSDHEILRL